MERPACTGAERMNRSSDTCLADTVLPHEECHRSLAARQHLDLLRKLTHRARGAEQHVGDRSRISREGATPQLAKVGFLERPIDDRTEVRELDWLREEPF